MNAVRIGLAAVAAAGAAGVVLVAAPPATDGGGVAEVLGARQSQAPQVDAACDVDGVGVSWDAAYSADEPAGYRVVTATITGVSPTCAGATVDVELTKTTESLATGTATAAATEVAVTFASPPPAADVDGVSVVIAGGTVPIPAECGTMTFDEFAVLTLDPDVHVATGDRDLVYGLDGGDWLRGGNRTDCLVGQDGDDLLAGENHDDVLVGGPGDDTLEGGNQNDVLHGGDGDDVLRGGNGRDRCVGGAGTNTYVSCEVQQ